MPVILSQIFSPADRAYKDAEWSLYHYPRQYFSRIQPYDRFIYYRPRGRRAARRDSATYFGHGILGVPFEDPFEPGHRFVPLNVTEPFPRLVGLRDPFGSYYETESNRPFQAQSAVRPIGEIVYHRILAAGGVAARGLELRTSTEAVAASGHFSPGPLTALPRDTLRPAPQIPEGAGYVPKSDSMLDIYESAALQERARKDHQEILRLIHASATRRGASCSYNNNIDLLLDFGDERELIEAKSLNDVRDAVNRMRYGIGQLADYGVRYRAELRGARAILAFGRPPDRETSWVSTVLEESGIGFVSRDGDRLLPLNDRAMASRLFA